MTINIRQIIYCNNAQTIDNYVSVNKCYESAVVPHIGESIYNYMWSEDVETKVVDVIYDFDKSICDVILEKRITSLSKENVSQLVDSHGWKETV